MRRKFLSIPPLRNQTSFARARMAVWPFILAAALLVVMALLGWRWYNSQKRNDHLEEQARLAMPWNTDVGDGAAASAPAYNAAVHRVLIPWTPSSKPSTKPSAKPPATPPATPPAAPEWSQAADANDVAEEHTLPNRPPVITVLSLDDDDNTNEDEEWSGVAPVILPSEEDALPPLESVPSREDATPSEPEAMSEPAPSQDEVRRSEREAAPSPESVAEAESPEGSRPAKRERSGRTRRK